MGILISINQPNQLSTVATNTLCFNPPKPTQPTPSKCSTPPSSLSSPLRPSLPLPSQAQEAPRAALATPTAWSPAATPTGPLLEATSSEAAVPSTFPSSAPTARAAQPSAAQPTKLV